MRENYRNTYYRCKAWLCNALVLLAFIFQSCESNPVGDNEIRVRNRTLGGKVTLGNNLDPKGVFIWLDGFDLSTTSDEQGRFEIVLPPPAVQSSNGGITGTLNLYFYMANFKLDTAAIFVRDGEFVYSQGDVNGEGELVKTVNLIQLLKIKTVMIPDSVTKNTQSLLSARIFLETTRKDTVTVYYPRKVDGVLNPLIFNNAETNETFVFQTTTAGLSEGDTLKITNNTPKEVILVLNASPNDFPFGVYHAIPYLFVIQENIPTGLINSIGPDVQQLGPNYLKIPFFRNLGQFTVTQPDEDIAIIN